METETHNQEGEGKQEEHNLPASLADLDLSPLNIIRTETVISRLPIHNLAKKGKVDIQIIHKTSKGEIDLKWVVSYNERFGQPRQIAYKLDTIVVNRKIEEEGRPLPEFIRLGSLREVATDLGLGSNTAVVKKAMFQNASAFIDAKFKYKGDDGSERSLQAGFTRYSVIFTGEKFPDGRKADAVYIRLNPEYRDVLNNAPVRPLDYDYLKILPPAAQRFYEIVSRKIFAALKHDHPVARLSYAEFCQFSAQSRQVDYDHFKKQMYKVHRPHLKSGYITKVEFQVSTDEEGKLDWIMMYTPGPKAKAEFNAFNGVTRVPRTRRRRVESNTIQARPEDSSTVTEITVVAQVLPVQGRGETEQKIITELTDRGVFETVAAQLLATVPPDRIETVFDYIDYWDSLQSTKKPGVGLLHSLIKNGDQLPPTFETRRLREKRLADEDRRQKFRAIKETLTTEYEQYRKQAVDRFITEELGEAEFSRRVAAHQNELASQSVLELHSIWNRPEVLVNQARREVKFQIENELSFLSFDDFRKREMPRILAELNLDPEELGIDLPKVVAEESKTISSDITIPS